MIGVVLFVAGAYGSFGDGSLVFTIVGLALAVVSVGFLITTQSRQTLCAPHPFAYVVIAIALALHAYENVAKMAGSFSLLWLFWALLPYGAVLALSFFRATRIAVIPAALLALAVDSWVHYNVFIEPKGSTAALALIWMPVWNTLIVIPLGTFLARLAISNRSVA